MRSTIPLVVLLGEADLFVGSDVVHKVVVDHNARNGYRLSKVEFQLRYGCWWINRS